MVCRIRAKGLCLKYPLHSMESRRDAGSYTLGVRIALRLESLACEFEASFVLALVLQAAMLSILLSKGSLTFTTLNRLWDRIKTLSADCIILCFFQGLHTACTVGNVYIAININSDQINSCYVCLILLPIYLPFQLGVRRRYAVCCARLRIVINNHTIL